MRPYFETADGRITIYHGDCRDVLPHLPREVLVTDPPYGTGRHVDERARGEAAPLHGRHVYDEWDRFSVDWLSWFAGPAAVFTSHARLGELIHAIGSTARVCYWRKSNPMPVTPPTEPCVVRQFPIPGGAEWFGYNGPSEFGHPTEKPLALMRWVLGFAPAGDVIDPFMGSGTTLRAAYDLGRRAIGIEINEQYCEIAAKRLAQGVLL